MITVESLYELKQNSEAENACLCEQIFKLEKQIEFNNAQIAVVEKLIAKETDTKPFIEENVEEKNNEPTETIEGII